MAKEIQYGFFPGGDPRDFVPDEDATLADLQAWRAACEKSLSAAASGNSYDERGAGYFSAEAGKVVAHVQTGKFGLGTYLVEVEDDADY